MALLGFMGRFSADYWAADIALPREADPRNFVKDPYQVKVKMECHFMARVMNVEKALTLLKKPDDCDFVLKVQDDMLSENSGSWRVRAEGVEKVDAAADVEMSIGRLSVLMLGFMNFDAACLQKDMQVYGKEDMLRRVFVEKQMQIAEFF